MDQLFAEITSLFTISQGRFENVAMLVALSMGLAWGSGVNLYGMLVVVGVMALTDHADLPGRLKLLGSYIVVAVTAAMYLIEFFVARTSREDETGWYAIQSFIYIPAGGLLAAGAVAGSGIVAAVGASIAGAFLTYVTYSSILGPNRCSDLFSRQTSTVFKDSVMLAGIWTVFHFPLLFMALLSGFIFFCILSRALRID